MSTSLTNVRIQLRHGTAAAWTAANPTLAEGEVGVEIDTSLKKVGDGGTPWNSLGYASSIPVGGATGEVLTKLSNSDYDVGWAAGGPATTDDLTEGVTNLYYTNARFDTQLATKTTTNLAEGTNLYYTQARFDSAFTAKSTTNLSEGTNLYHTSARVNTLIASATITESQVTNLTTDLAAKLPLAGGTLTGSLAASGATVTTSTPILDLTQTWNAGAVQFTALKLNVTDTASASNSLLVSLFTGGVSKFYIDKNGGISIGGGNASVNSSGAGSFNGITCAGHLLFTDNTYDIGASGATRPRTGYFGTSLVVGGGATFGNGTDGAISLYEGSNRRILLEPGGSSGTGQYIQFASGVTLQWGSSANAVGSVDSYFGREGAAILQLGLDSATPIAQTLKGPDARAGTDTNVAGGNLTIAAGRNTGSAVGGSLLFQTAPAGSTGTAAGTLTTRLTIDSTGLTTSTLNGIAATPTDSLLLTNTTAAISGTQQYSPALRFTGQGWGTTAGTSQAVDWRVYNVPVQSTVPTSALTFDFAVAGGAFANKASLASSGSLSLVGGLSCTTINGNGNATIANGNVQIADTKAFYWSTRAQLLSPADGIIAIENNTGTGFTRLQFGGTTAAFPALARSSTSLKCRLADDSADAAFTCGDFTVGGGAAVKKILTATAVLDFGNTLAQTDSDLTVTVTGAALGDVVILGVPHGATQTGSCFTAWVSATDTVTIRFSVYGIAAKDPASGTYRVTVLQF